MNRPYAALPLENSRTQGGDAVKFIALVDGGSNRRIEIEKIEDGKFRIDGKEREVSVEVIETAFTP
jgi:hypothetical protein